MAINSLTKKKLKVKCDKKRLAIKFKVTNGKKFHNK